jgi:hypothetical protein
MYIRTASPFCPIKKSKEQNLNIINIVYLSFLNMELRKQEGYCRYIQISYVNN